MIGRPSRRSTATPATFIATSSSPTLAPITSSAPASSGTVGAKPISTREPAADAVLPATTTRAPARSISRPATEAAASIPTLAPSRARPNTPGEACTCAVSAGVRDAHEPSASPLRANTVNTAIRSRMTPPSALPA